jgi:hypothetical protein
VKIDWSKVITSKTVWLGIITCLISVLEYIQQLPHNVGVITGVIGVLIIIVRFLTNDGLTTTQPPAPPNTTNTSTTSGINAPPLI